MKNILTTLLLLFSVISYGQTKVELEVENDNGNEQYKLKLEREIDGKTVVTEKTYGSIEEIKNDPELKDIELHFMEGSESSFPFKSGEAHESIEIDEDVSEGGHKMMFISKTGEENTKIEVIIDEDGTHHVTVNGEEVDYEEWKKNNELHLDSNSMEWTEKGEEGKHIKKEIIIKVSGEGEEGIHVERNVNYFVLHLEDINKEDEKAFSLEGNKELKLDEFNFYPNPSNGTFQLKFQGKNRPTLVRVADINGKEVFAENLQNFEGVFDQEINLSELEKGIYLLQVVQGSKSVNKKIIIEK